MKKIILAAVVCAVSSLSAAAYFDGGVSATTGPDGYRGTKLDLVLGSGNIALEPSMASYTSDALDKTYRTYALRGAWEADKYTVAGEAGTTPEVNGYSNKFFGGDITFSLTPGQGGKSRLAGPGSRGMARGGQGVTRIDVGAGLKHTVHALKLLGVKKETGQTEASLFAGAKVFIVNLAASYTKYSYGEEKSAMGLNNVTGHSFIYNAFPKSSVNVKLDLPGYPLLTPYVSYTRTSYKGTLDDSSAYLFGAYIDLSMITANVGWQVFDDGSGRDSFLSVGAGLRF